MSALFDGQERTILHPDRQRAETELARGLMNQLIVHIEPHDAGCHCPLCDAFDALARAL